MKIALFIIKDQIDIIEQMLKFIENLKVIDLRNEDIIIIEKVEKAIFKKRNKIKFNIDRLLGLFSKDVVIKLCKKITFRNIHKKYKNLNIKKYNISTTNSEQTKKIISENSIDINIFIFYDEVVKPEILSLARMNLNVHPGILPDFRGCQPLFWQLFHGSHISEVTLHKMQNGIDEGDIVFEVPFVFNPGRSVYYNYVMSAKNIHLLLLMGLRRLIFYDINFGINQSAFKGRVRYFSRPTPEDRKQLKQNIPRKKQSF